MNLNETAFVVLIGAGFILLFGLAGLFEILMVNLFDSERKTSTGLHVRTSASLVLIALGVCLLAWNFI